MVLADVNTILKAKNACDIFKNDNGITGIKSQYKAYARKYHPDICHRNDIMAKVNVLYEKALSLVDSGIWDEKDVLYIVDKNNRKFKFKYRVCYPFEFGMCYVGNQTIAYVFNADAKDFYYNMLNMIESIRYKDRKMKEYFSKVMPKLIRYDKNRDGSFYAIIDKPSNVYPMTYVLKYFNNSFTPKHTAWVMTRLCNIECFLNVTGLVHNGISIENLFVCPETHDILLLGGWWYASKIGKRMIGCSGQVYNLLPPKTKKDKLATSTTDIECIKDVCKRILDKSNFDSYREIRKWYTSVSNENPFDNLDKWDNALTRQFGKRKFIKMDVRDNLIYGGK